MFRQPSVPVIAAKRNAVEQEVRLALARGRKRSHIGYAVNDPSFVFKLLEAGHDFRYGTLCQAYDILTRDRKAYENAVAIPATASVLT